ncbi:MAG: ATP-binding cassette domain-containing protein, partial [Sulfurifustaceae bacterium]
EDHVARPRAEMASERFACLARPGPARRRPRGLASLSLELHLTPPGRPRRRTATQLSGGERQSIALARLFLRKPKLLILDEPTSALDGEALQVVLAALRSLMSGCTTFIVTHNLETIRLAERVLFLDSDRLRGGDTHEKLYAHNPHYRALWEEATERGGAVLHRAHNAPAT